MRERERGERERERRGERESIDPFINFISHIYNKDLDYRQQHIVHFKI